MAFCIDKMRTDKAAESDGVWVNAGAGLRLKIARLGNPKYTKYLNELLKPVREEVTGVGELDASLVQKATIQAIAKHILVGWENLTETKTENGIPVLDEQGNPIEVPIPYSYEKAHELLNDVPDFGEMVLGYAKRLDLYRVKTRKAQEGN